MIVKNQDGSATITDKDGNVVRYEIGLDPNGSDRMQLLSTGSTGNPSPIFEGENSAGRASGRFIDCGGSADVLTDPETGFVRWAG
jgi:hypothetical protein